MDINDLARELNENARDKGFYEHEDWLKEQLQIAKESGDAKAIKNWTTALAEHFGNRTFLIASEAVEAFEELRSGEPVDGLYFRQKNGKGPRDHDAVDEFGNLNKPEGNLMELVDIGVRTLETLHGYLANMTEHDAATLREQIMPSEHTDAVVGGDPLDGPVPGPVTVAELFHVKMRYNASRAAMHGRKF